MEPRIQYAKTSDGVSIAYWTLGEGEPLVYMPSFPWNHVQLEWVIPQRRLWYETLAKGLRLVRFDFRGCGLSERHVDLFTIETFMLDLEAVLKRLNLQRIALWAEFHSGPIAISYAARHPDKVSHLCLWHAYAAPSHYPLLPQPQAARVMIASDWEMFTEMGARANFGWSDNETASLAAKFMRECVEPGVARAQLQATDSFDVLDLLPKIDSPTLVFHSREFRFPSLDVARVLASRIPDARLVVLEGTSPIPPGDRPHEVAQAIEEFFGLAPIAETAAEWAPPQGTAVILFADIVDSTALTERMGDTAFRDKARDLDSTLRSVIRKNAGKPIDGKLLGDGVLAVFTSARQSIEAALACGRAGDSAGLPLHLGIHAGDVIREDNNVYGGAVNIAARISGLSVAGEVLVSDVVRTLARTSAGVRFEDRGERDLKGVGEPVRVWSVRAAD